MTGYEFIKTADDRFFVRAKQARARKGKVGVTGKELHRITTAILLLAGDARCAVTGASLYPSNSHADHVTPFKDLADQFVASVGGIDMIPIVPSADGVMQHHVADGVVKETWQAFHREHAVLRLVTAEANLKRKYGDA